MKYKSLIAFLFIILLAVSYSISQGENGQDQPNAVILNSIYKFDQIPEGNKIVHDFILKNTGNATLEIQKIHTG